MSVDAPQAGARSWRAAGVVGAAVCALTVAVLAASVHDHPLYDPDEGRYARTTQETLAAGNLLVPIFQGEPRLQKPPVVHWLQGAAFLLLGENELAARLPSLLFTALTGVILFQTARRVRDTATGLIAVGLFTGMPLVMVVGRLSIIDPVLNFFWVAAVFTGYLALAGGRPAHDRGPADATNLWACFVALGMGMLTKGPIALLPAAGLAVWMAAGGRLRQVRAWQWVAGAAVTVGPLLAWAGAVIASHPDALDLWNRETLDRIRGTGDHVEPVWYYLPVVLAGFFPATALLPVPGVHYRVKAIGGALRAGGLEPLLALSVLVPLVLLSAMRGKLATYVLPLAAPVALAAAVYVRRWLDVTLDHRDLRAAPDHVAQRLPDGVGSIAVIITLGSVVAAALAHIPVATQRMHLSAEAIDVARRLTLGLVAVSALPWAAYALWRQAATRVWAVAVLGATTLAMYAWVEEMGEDAMTIPAGNPRLLAAVHQRIGEGVFISTFGFREPTLSFYRGQWVPRLDTLDRPAGAAELPWVVLVEDRDHDAFTAAVARRGVAATHRFDWRRPRETVHVYTVGPVTKPLTP